MIIISGATGGIGNFLFAEYLRKNREIIGLYHTQPPREHSQFFRQIDICRLQDIDHFVQTEASQLKQLVLINCAGINYNAFAHKADPGKWEEVIRINLVGTFNLIQGLLPLMREQHFGRIINLSSVVGQKAIAGTSAYAASKAGLNGMIKAISAENISRGITINNLNLGYFDRGMIRDVPEEMQDQLKKQLPGNKFGNPMEIFRAIEFLIGSEYLTGSIIDISGGI